MKLSAFVLAGLFLAGVAHAEQSKSESSELRAYREYVQSLSHGGKVKEDLKLLGQLGVTCSPIFVSSSTANLLSKFVATVLLVFPKSFDVVGVEGPTWQEYKEYLADQSLMEEMINEHRPCVSYAQKANILHDNWTPKYSVRQEAPATARTAQ